MSDGIRERTRRHVRAEIAEAVSDLFTERGFDAVTVEEAAREAGISRATFFRYFESKEEALLATLESASADYGAVLSELPPVQGENVWQLLHRTFRTALADVDDSPERDRARLRMVQATPSLRARLTVMRFENEDSLASSLTRRGVPVAAAHTIVTAAFMGLDLAWRRWAIGEEVSWQDSVAEVFAHLAGANAPLAEMGQGHQETPGKTTVKEQT